MRLDVRAAARDMDVLEALPGHQPARNSTNKHMNRFDKFFGLKGEAKVRFLDGEFQVTTPGDFVRCGVSGEPIMLADLRYWSVELQEAYASAEISLKRVIERRRRGEG